MIFDVFAYDFPHWKTCLGLMHLVTSGHRPDMVWLAPRKELNIPRSNYRIAPAHEFWPHPQQLCEALRIDYKVIDHDELGTNPYQTDYLADFAVILGARILKQHTIDAYDGKIMNIHPGILPGNRGLDNLKWAIAKGLPIGATAHWIDSRVDMGLIIHREYCQLQPDTTLMELVPLLRTAELECLIYAMNNLKWPEECEPVTMSEKFSAVPDHIDRHLPELWERHKKTVMLEMI